MEDLITAKQSGLISKICSRLDLEFDMFYSTKQEASEFIKQHIDEYNSLATHKQLNYINNICRCLCVKFEGRTKQEAHEFIKKYEFEYLKRQNEIYEKVYGTDSMSDFEMEDYCGIPPWDI